MNKAINVWNEELQSYTGIPALKGESGIFPRVSIPYSEQITLRPNTETVISTLEGNIEIFLEEGMAGYSNEWRFLINLGNTAYNVVLPETQWFLGVTPTFSPNTTTEIRLHYKGENLIGICI